MRTLHERKPKEWRPHVQPVHARESGPSFGKLDLRQCCDRAAGRAWANAEQKPKEVPMSHFHAVVWIDHREARVFHFSADDVESATIHADQPKKHLHHKHGSIGSGHAKEDQEYFHKVAEAVSDAGAILITGPANAKTELVKHIEKHDPGLRKKVAAVETLDHPTSGEIVAHARKYFARDNQMPSRIKQH
jgi:hypothetical protein